MTSATRVDAARERPVSRRAIWAGFLGTAGLLTVGVGFGIMGERLADEHCSVLPPGARKEHRSLTDLARATGTEEEIMAVFRAMRDVVTQRMDGLIARLREESAV